MNEFDFETQHFKDKFSLIEAQISEKKLLYSFSKSDGRNLAVQIDRQSALQTS